MTVIINLYVNTSVVVSVGKLKDGDFIGLRTDVTN